MTDINQIRKAVVPLKIIFWVQVVVLASLVFHEVWQVILQCCLSAREPGQVVMLYRTADRILGVAGTLLILILSLQLTRAFKGRTRVWPLCVVAVIEASVFVGFLMGLLLPWSVWLTGPYSSFLWAWARIVGFVYLADMFLISLFTAWLCRDAHLPDIAARWKRTAWLFIFLYMLPNAIYGLLPLLPFGSPFGGIWIIYRWPFRLGIAVLTRYPLLLFYKSIKVMMLDARLAASGETQGDMTPEGGGNE